MTTDAVIDMKVFNEIAELMDDSLGLFIETYLENSPKLLDGIRLALAASDNEKVMMNAHQLKGGSGSIGAMHVFGLAKQIENMVKEGEIDQLGCVFTELEGAYSAVDADLRARIP